MAPPPPFAERVRQTAERLCEDGIGGLEELFDLTSDRLVRLAVTITRNQHDAEDAVQAAVVRVGLSPGLLSSAENPWGYLLRMVRNQALLVARRKRRWVLRPNINDLLTVRLVDEVEREETHRAVWTALRTLPTEQAEVVVLKVWEGLTFAQAAEVLEISPNTAASRYQYALEKLSRRLAPHRLGAHHG